MHVITSCQSTAFLQIPTVEKLVVIQFTRKSFSSISLWGVFRLWVEIAMTLYRSIWELEMDHFLSLSVCPSVFLVVLVYLILCFLPPSGVSSFPHPSVHHPFILSVTELRSLSWWRSFICSCVLSYTQLHMNHSFIYFRSCTSTDFSVHLIAGGQSFYYRTLKFCDTLKNYFVFCSGLSS